MLSHVCGSYLLYCVYNFHSKLVIYCGLVVVVDAFRYQTAFHNVDLTSLREAAVQEYFKQPIVV